MLFTFCVRHSQSEMYSGHVTAVCVSVCLSLAAFPHYCMELDVSWGNRRGCDLVAHYWANLQLVDGFRSMTTQHRTRNVSECLYSLYAWFILLTAN